MKRKSFDKTGIVAVTLCFCLNSDRGLLFIPYLRSLRLFLVGFLEKNSTQKGG